MATRTTVDVAGTPVHGIDVDAETRCAHYASDRDVLAIKFACCGEYYPCLECHDALVSHERAVWPRVKFDQDAVLCGRCGEPRTIGDYLQDAATCPHCGGAFNPGCRSHWPQYFAVDH